MKGIRWGLDIDETILMSSICLVKLRLSHNKPNLLSQFKGVLHGEVFINCKKLKIKSNMLEIKEEGAYNPSLLPIKLVI